VAQAAAPLDQAVSSAQLDPFDALAGGKTTPAANGAGATS
jgi:hypothetical protein